MAKFKCSNPKCGHVFEGDELSTYGCPMCGDSEIKLLTQIDWKKILMYVGGIGIFLLVITLFGLAAGGEPEFQAKLTANKSIVEIRVELVSGSISKNIWQLYRIEVQGPGEAQYSKLDKNDELIINVSKFQEGQTYRFALAQYDKKLEKYIRVDCQWNENSYTKPMAPKAPVLALNKDADCGSNTYTISVEVVEGHADEYILNGISQASNVFENISPSRTKYIVRAVDRGNNLTSTDYEIMCPEIRDFHVTKEEIQRVFDMIAEEKIKQGDALYRISNGDNIPLTKAVDGCEKLESLLNYAEACKVHYIVTDVSITHDNCNDVVNSISVTRR